MALVDRYVLNELDMEIFIFNIGSAISLLLVGGFVFSLKKYRGFGWSFLRGWMWQVVLSLPAGIWQALKGWPNAEIQGAPIFSRLTIPLVGWPFNAGGLTVRYVFEASVKPLEFLAGPRTGTVLGNMPYYALLLVIQGSIVAGLFAWRLKKRGTIKDRVIICIVVLFLINSLLNVTWNWAGT